MTKRGRLDLEDIGITKLVIVNGHGVTAAERGDPHDEDNEVTVEYPTILTAHLGTQTRIHGYLDTPAVDICGILTTHIEEDLKPFDVPLISFREIVRALKKRRLILELGHLQFLQKRRQSNQKFPGIVFKI
jgi:hypothetical protein